MLGHVVAMDHRADADRDGAGATERSASARNRGLDAAEIAFRRRAEVFAFALAQGGKIGIATDNEPLAGKFRRGDARPIALIEERELQRATFAKRLDRRGT